MTFFRYLIFYCVLFVFSALLPNTTFAQFGGGLSGEVGGGLTQLYGEMAHKPLKPGYHLGIDYIVIPFVSVGLQGMMGKLAADDWTGRSAENNYIGANINAKARLGLVLNGGGGNFELNYIREPFFKSLIRNLYIGAGIGFLRNDVEARRSTSEDPNFVGADKSKGAFVPLNAGIDIPFGYSLSGPTWAVNVNAQLGLYFGDELDGYANMYSQHDDRLFYFSLSIKRSFLHNVKR
ncbi:hypothetical protein RYH73_17720 [Olivibacter sp. CPCC 100613]|uniref:hypothetical protein n=1 Tax=Olivibacter sp. CPCC 100613 TaxID=3079931 RepID=UPI002FF61BAB